MNHFTHYLKVAPKHWSGLVWALLIAIGQCTAQSPTPFDCSSGLGYIVTNPTTNASGNVSSLYSITLTDGSSTLIKDGVIPGTTSESRFLNAIGYNVKDNFLYGYRYNSNQIVRVGSNGAVTLITVSGLSTSGAFATGDVDANGVLYLFGASNIVLAIDLTVASPVAQTQVSGATVLSGLNDWAVSPINGKIYGVTTNKNLVVYDPVAKTASQIGAVSGLGNESGSFGTAFMDSNGNLYIGNNTSGRIYRIAMPHNLTTGSTITATLFSSSLAGKLPGDGARCPSQVIGPSANNDSKCGLTSTAPISLTVAANDGTGSNPLDPASVRLVDPVSGSAVSSVTVSGQGSYSVNTTTGVVTFTPVSGFGRSTIKYTIADTQGNRSGQATIFVYLCSLPVTLTRFEAVPDASSITLNWKTSLEIGFDHFEVERTTDPRNRFDFVAYIAPKPDAIGGLYVYDDQAINPGETYYYRLKMIDLDGSVAYSTIVSAKLSMESTLRIFPNPAHAMLTFTSDEPTASYQLVSVSGRVVLSRNKVDSQQVEVSLSGVQPGVYILRTTSQSGLVVNRKVLIE